MSNLGNYSVICAYNFRHSESESPRSQVAGVVILTPGNIIVNSPVNVKLQLPPGHTGLFMLVSQKAEKGVIMLARVYELIIIMR